MYVYACVLTDLGVDCGDQPHGENRCRGGSQMRSQLRSWSSWWWQWWERGEM